MEYGFSDDDEAPLASSPVPMALPGPGSSFVAERRPPPPPQSVLQQSSVMQPPMMPMPMMQMPPPPMRSMGEAQPVVENGHTLGLSFLVVGIGSAIGVAYAGLFGGAAGALMGGSSINALRAYKHFVKGTAADDKEATISATYAVLSAGASLYLFYKGRSVAKPNDTKKIQTDVEEENIEGLE